MNDGFIDISLPLYPGSITYPDNPPVTFKPKATLTNVITKISFGSHSGTHIDAPSHAKIDSGVAINGLSLEIFHGQTRVLDVSKAIESVNVSDLDVKNIQKGERVLLKTSNSGRWNEGFFPDFVFLSP